MIVLFTGSRRWDREEPVRKRLEELPAGSEVIHGAAKGLDMMVHRLCIEMNIKVHAFPAQWKKHGKAAGPIRDRQMLDEFPDLVIAFHENLSKSKGTIDTINEAKRRNIEVEIYTV